MIEKSKSEFTDQIPALLIVAGALIVLTGFITLLRGDGFKIIPFAVGALCIVLGVARKRKKNVQPNSKQ